VYRHAGWHIALVSAQMAKRLARFFLSCLIAVNGIPAITAPSARPVDRETVIDEWANALGMSGDFANYDEITSIEYWGTGTINLNSQPCVLTDYHASIKYKVPGMRLEFACADSTGTPHHEAQVVAGKTAWNENNSGTGSTSAMSAVDQRLIQLWTGPLALVRAASIAGARTHVALEAGKIVVTFPIPGVANVVVKATLNGKYQAEQVDTLFADGSVIQTTYTEYAELNGSDLQFDTYFPHRIVQKQGSVTLADLTVTKTSTSNVALVMQAPSASASVVASDVAAPIPSDAHKRAPQSWKNAQAWKKLDESLRARVESGCSGPQAVIIRTKTGYRAGLRQSLAQHGDQVSGEFPSINAVGASVACKDLETLASFDTTLSMSVNARMTANQNEQPADPPAAPVDPPAPPVNPPASAADARDAEGQAAAVLQAPMLQTLLGDNYEQIRSQPSTRSIGIAIIDSGIEPGPDFGDRITAFYDFTQGDVRAAAPSDQYGHGSHVAGLAASRYVGVDPSARLVGLKVLDGQGRGSADSVLRAVEFAVVNKDLLNIQVLNLSLGHPIYERATTDPLVQVVESAVRSGLVVVVAAGNVGLKPHTIEPGYSGIVSPANSPSAFSVGAVRTHNTATRDDDQIALFSSRGPTRYDGFAKPDFSAPGQNLLSVAPVGSTLRLHEEAKGNSNGNYMRLNGTSMAAGVVSGFAALALQANPAFTPNALKAVLEYSSIDVNSLTGAGSADFLTQGAGEISGGALALVANIDASAPAGTPWLSAAVPHSTTIDGHAWPWVQRLLWGNYPLSGADLLDDQRSAFALNAVWGNSLVGDLDNIVSGNSFENDQGEDDNIVWGNSLEDDLDNIVWGNSLEDELDNIVWGNSFGDDQGEDDNIVWGNSAGDFVDSDAPNSTAGGPAGSWLKSPGTRIVIHSTAFQTVIKRHHRAGEGRTN